MKLVRNFVEKPWGRTDLPLAFGDLGGRRVGEVWYEDPKAVQLPILVKWLFTSEKLSISVHPNDAQAKALGFKSGKDECWYIVDAGPNAVLGIGTTCALSKTELRDASLSGEIENLMDWKPVKTGDYFHIPAGTVHAIGADITLVEVQQYADVNFRLYDYGRPRELHLINGIAVADAQPYCDQRSGHVSANGQLSAGPHFTLWCIDSEDSLAAVRASGRQWIVPLEGYMLVNKQRASVGECFVVEANDSIKCEQPFKMLVAA